MNLNEFFFFKAIPCANKDKHDLDICYFFHIPNHDFRRLIINFLPFLKINSLNLSENDESDCIVNKSLFEYYTNENGFESDELNKLLFESNPCKNPVEMRYHIFNYKTSECVFHKLNLKCPYGKLCPDVHSKGDKSEEEIENDQIQKDFQMFKSFLEALTDRSKLLTKNEVIEIYNTIYNASNSYYEATKKIMPYCAQVEKGRKDKLQLPSQKEKVEDFQSPWITSIVTKPHSSKNLRKALRVSTVPRENLCMTKNIYDELKNIPMLMKGELYYHSINTDNSLVFLSNTLPKKEEINKLLISFLNSHNGIIIYGADINTNKLSGIKMDRKSRDLFRQIFNTEYKEYLIEYENSIKYKFYELENHGDNMCLLVIKVKKIKDCKMIFDPYNKVFVIKDKFLKKFEESTEEKEKVKLTDIKNLNMKEYVEIVRYKLIKYYKAKQNV